MEPSLTPLCHQYLGSAFGVPDSLLVTEVLPFGAEQGTTRSPAFGG